MGKSLVLRTMNLKSKFHFGRYKNYIIKTLLVARKTGYLRYAYYNYTTINYTNDVLMQIGITEEWRIQKPGKNPEMFFKLEDTFDHTKPYGITLVSMSKTGLSPNKNLSSKIQYKKAKEQRDFREQNKSKLQGKNQGHF